MPLLRGLRNDGTGGFKVRPGKISDVDEPFASLLVEAGAAVVVAEEPEKLCNVPDAGTVRNECELADGARVLLKL